MSPENLLNHMHSELIQVFLVLLSSHVHFHTFSQTRPSWSMLAGGDTDHVGSHPVQFRGKTQKWMFPHIYENTRRNREHLLNTLEK